MNPLMWFVSGVLLLANPISALPHGIDQFPTAQDIMQRLSDLEYRLSKKMLHDTDKCALEWNGICFFALFYHRGMVNQEAARLGCKKRGAELGNIYAEEQYDDIMHYLRPYIAAIADGGSSYGIRTGMIFEPKSQTVFLTNGTEAPFVHWTPSYPKAQSGRKTVSLSVYPKGSTYNGMYNLGSEQLAAAILCQIPI